MDGRSLSADEEEALQRWLNSDPRNKGAMMRAQALSMMSESAKALGPGFNPAAFNAPAPATIAPRHRFAGLSRRQALGWGGGAVAAASVAALGISLPAMGATITTGRGEIRLVPLKDGSTALLNTNSSIRIGYNATERFITVLDGEVYFSVTHDAKRPFVVEVGGKRLRTMQATFRVQKLNENPVDVLVQQGRVDLPVGDAPNSHPLSLQANMRMNLGAGSTGRLQTATPQNITPETVMRELAWREGRLAFEGETLKQAATAFARYSDTHIIIPDPVLAQEPVTGLFAANDPAGFSRAIARIFDARLEQGNDRLILTRPAASQ